MSSLLAFFLSYLLVAGAQEEEDISAQIINGTTANSTQFAWQASIYVNLTFVCGGVLISPKYVLTAAHCITFGNVSVRIGATKREAFDGGSIVYYIPSENIFKHPNASSAPNPLRNDLAMIKLPLAIVFPTKPAQNATIRVINLPKSSDKKKTYVGATAYMSGWGSFGPAGDATLSDSLLWTSNLVISNLDCQAKFSSQGQDYVYNGSICTTTASNTGICHGDDGGPLVVYGSDKKYTLIGVASFFNTTNCLDGYSGFTRVTYFLGWITKILRK